MFGIDDIQKDQVRLILDRHLNAFSAAGGCQYVELSGLLQIEFDEKSRISSSSSTISIVFLTSEDLVLKISISLSSFYEPLKILTLPAGSSIMTRVPLPGYFLSQSFRGGCR